MNKSLLTFLFTLSFFVGRAQNEFKNWYFGDGTDGITFINNIPQKLSNKRLGVGFEGMIVVNNPLQGNLLFYCDGETVVDANHNVMTNGTGLTGHYSGAQCVQACPVAGSCYKKFYLFTNSAWDDVQAGQISYSIVDFTTNPLGVVTNKNTLIWNGPSDEGMCLVNKPGTNDYWLISSIFKGATYYVWPVTSAGIGSPQTYAFTRTGACYQLSYNRLVSKICATGWANKKITLIDFNPNTGVLSNENTIGTQFNATWATRFSADGTKLYAGATGPTESVPSLYQYDFNNSVWTRMSTCCYAHDLKLGPDNKMYFLRSYSDPQPMSVIDFPNLTAVGNACNYHQLTFSPPFNGETRRFPEVLILPDPPTANIDSVVITTLSTSVPALVNDFDPQADPLSFDTIVTPPIYGTATIVGNTIRYVANQIVCGRVDSLVYRIKDTTCGTDTARIYFKYPQAIDSVRIKSTITGCGSVYLEGLAFTGSTSIQSWHWIFDDNTNANTQNTSHTFSTPGIHSVKLIVTNANGCKDSTSVNITTTGSSIDFFYRQDVCNPLLVQFSNAGNTPTNLQFFFGDGGNENGNLNPTHIYSSGGNYTVKYIGQNGNCIDTVTKIISVGIVADNIITTNDTTICFGSTKQLFTKPSFSFCWSPTTSLDNPLSPNPITNSTTPITYYFTAELLGDNLIANGDFTNGNTSFTSGYNFMASNTTEGEYFVGVNPQSWNANLNPCVDHTAGNGNMLLVNGSPVLDIVVWQQTVNVTPNTNYAFVTWIQALSNLNPARLSFTINGKDIGNLITASLPSCTWSRFYNTWNSGNNTTAVVSINNKNTILEGNDFALDDISFAPVMIKKDSVKISIDKPVVNAGNDTLVCEKSTVPLLASGAAAYSWQPVNGLNNTNINNPFASVNDTIQYVVQGTSLAGCTATDTITIFTKKSPTIIAISDTSFCKGRSIQLSVSGGNNYEWLPIAGLNNPFISNPITNSDTSINYFVKGNGSNGCSDFDTVKITVHPLPVVKTIGDTSICTGKTLRLTTTGADFYNWQPATGLSNVNTNNPSLTVVDTIQYIVQGKNLFGCAANDTINIYPRKLPVISAGTDIITCELESTQLVASGASTYSWLPVTGLNNASIFNPIAIVSDTTEYTVTGFDAFGCSNKDTIVIFTNPLPVITLTVDTTVCKNTSLQLFVGGGNNYQWFPPAGLSNPNVSNPIATVSNTTVYHVSITGSNACIVKDSVTIFVKAPPVFSISPNDSTCVDKPVQLQANGGNKFSWQPAALLSDPTIANPLATVNSTTVFSVVINENFCNVAETLTTTIKILPTPSVNAYKSNNIDCSFPSAQLSATGAGEYIWSPAESLSNSGPTGVIATPTSTTLYTVIGTDANTKCTASDTITVVVTKSMANTLFIPSAFSPNETDNLNNCWKATYNGAYNFYSISIYNRWGELVFHADDPNKCWNGIYKGKKQPIGNYVYIIKLRNACREQFKKGSLLLIR